MKKSQIRGFRRNLRSFERLTNAQLKSCCGGVTLAQCLVLMEIDECGRLTMGQLAARLRLDTSTLTRTVDGLAARSLVERQRSESDRRVVWIRLTADGEAECRSLHRVNDAYYRRVFEKIPSEQRATVMQSFEALVQACLDCESESSAVTCCDAASSGKTDGRRGESEPALAKAKEGSS